MDERLESSWHLVYYQVQESQGSLAVVVDLTFTMGSVDLCASLFIDHCCVILFFTMVLTARLFYQRNFPNLWYFRCYMYVLGLCR